MDLFEKKNKKKNFSIFIQKFFFKKFTHSLKNEWKFVFSEKQMCFQIWKQQKNKWNWVFKNLFEKWKFLQTEKFYDFKLLSYKNMNLLDFEKLMNTKFFEKNSENRKFFCSFVWFFWVFESFSIQNKDIEKIKKNFLFCCCLFFKKFTGKQRETINFFTQKFLFPLKLITTF